MTQLCNLTHPHKHGGANCYDVGKCRCASCTDGNSARTRHRRRLKAYGQWEGLVNSTGSQRRIQGLQLLGFTFDQIGAAAGVNRNTVWRVLIEQTIEPKTRDRINVAFKELLRTPDAGLSKRTARLSKAKGYVSAYAWDDIDTDSEPADDGAQIALRGEELLAEIDWLMKARTPPHEIARAVNKSLHVLERHAWRYQRPDIAMYLHERSVA